jgi:hypothetical protein
MTETKKIITSMTPTEAHYSAAAYSVAKATKTSKPIVRKAMQEHFPDGFATVRHLAIWVDGVLWCGGDPHARNALFDRIESKAARLVDHTIQDTRTPMSDTRGASKTASESYMDSLPKPPLVELTDEGPTDDDSLM